MTATAWVGFGVALAVDVLWARAIRGTAATYAAGPAIASTYNTIRYLQAP